jgi:DNA-binding response OmpR family regulator
MTEPLPLHFSPIEIVVVEDHDLVRQELVAFLSRPEWAVRGAEDADAMDKTLRTRMADIAVIDLNLPGEDGLSIAQRLRRARPDIGIVMLTARLLPKDKTAGYRSGADVYLTKPANVGELEAVICNLSRRVKPRGIPQWQLDLPRLRLVADAPSPITLTKLEAEFLYLLSIAPDRMIDSSTVLHRLARVPGCPADKTHLAVIVSRLRAKGLQNGISREWIKAVRGHGYQLLEAIVLIKGS